MTDQIAYLEKLLEGYKERMKRGETNLIDRIRVTASKLDEERLKLHYEEQKKPSTAAPRPSVLQHTPRGCCGRR